MNKEQWKAIEQRDASYDGVFYYGWKPSKTICRPSCTVRVCDPKKIVIFDSVEEGKAQGYHPCRRCRPDLPEWRGAKPELASRAQTYIKEHYTEKFSLETIAEALFVDRIYLSKTFKEITGETLLSYHNQVRCEQASKLLTDTSLSMEIIGSRVGYATPSHFARIFRSIYHCSPSAYRNTYLESLAEDNPGE